MNVAVSYDASMSNHLPAAEGWLLCSFQIVSKVRKFVIGLIGPYSRLADDLRADSPSLMRWRMRLNR